MSLNCFVQHQSQVHGERENKTSEDPSDDEYEEDRGDEPDDGQDHKYSHLLS